MNERSYRRLLWGLAFLGLLLDQGSKYLVFHVLYNHGEGERRPLISRGLRPADAVHVEAGRPR